MHALSTRGLILNACAQPFTREPWVIQLFRRTDLRVPDPNGSRTYDLPITSSNQCPTTETQETPG